ncbi:hypothetical protein COOONC_26007 [Cooperia oncophora]
MQWRCGVSVPFIWHEENHESLVPLRKKRDHPLLRLLNWVTRVTQTDDPGDVTSAKHPITPKKRGVRITVTADETNIIAYLE